MLLLGKKIKKNTRTALDLSAAKNARVARIAVRAVGAAIPIGRRAGAQTRVVAALVAVAAAAATLRVSISKTGNNTA